MKGKVIQVSFKLKPTDEKKPERFVNYDEVEALAKRRVEEEKAREKIARQCKHGRDLENIDALTAGARAYLREHFNGPATIILTGSSIEVLEGACGKFNIV